MGQERVHSMAYKKVRLPYAIYYNDGTYMVYDFNEDDYKAITLAMESDRHTVVIAEVGVLKLGDIRSIIKQKPEPKAPKSAAPEMNSEEAEWYAQQMAAWENYGKDNEGGIEQ